MLSVGSGGTFCRINTVWFASGTAFLTSKIRVSEGVFQKNLYNISCDEGSSVSGIASLIVLGVTVDTGLGIDIVDGIAVFFLSFVPIFTETVFDVIKVDSLSQENGV